jgi:hypothetical protein
MIWNRPMSEYPSHGRLLRASIDRWPRTLTGNSRGGRVPRNRCRVSLSLPGVGRRRQGARGRGQVRDGISAPPGLAGQSCQQLEPCSLCATRQSKPPRGAPVVRSTSVRMSTPLDSPTCRNMPPLPPSPSGPSPPLSPYSISTLSGVPWERKGGGRKGGVAG